MQQGDIKITWKYIYVYMQMIIYTDICVYTLKQV